MNTIKITNLTKEYENEKVLDNVSFSARKGEVITIIGPSGGGKSTFLRCIAGLDSPSSGTIELSGNPGMVFQSFNLFQNLTVQENICLALRQVQKYSNTVAKSIALKVLAQVGLTEKANAYPSRLSGGQSQRAAIARMIACNPQVLLFDEPTSALDPYLKNEVLELIRQIATDKERTILLVTHELSFARKISTRIMKMESGRLTRA